MKYSREKTNGMILAIRFTIGGILLLIQELENKGTFTLRSDDLFRQLKKNLVEIEHNDIRLIVDLNAGVESE